jgi:hypothetical protein
MADKHSILKSIKVLLGLETVSPVYTLADGTPIEVSELVVGGTVIVGDGPAPAGEHILSDGQTIVVDENGVITEIRPVAVEAPEMPEDMGGDPAAPVTKATIEQMVKDAVKEAVGEQMKSYTTGLAKQGEAVRGMVNLMEEILKMPTVTSEPPKQTFSKAAPESKTEKYGKILNQFQTIKNK